MAPLALAALATLALAAPLLAQNNNNKSRLPDIGSSAGEVLGPSQQAEYGAMTLSQLRHYGYILDDPLLEDWLQSVGHKLAANSDKPRQSFTFFLMKDRQINAFATLGGYVGTNAGLVLAATREDQVASVLAHEIAHVTQDHVLRGVERAQRDSVPILLAMLGAILVAQQAGGNSSDDASMAALSAGQALMYQRQIDYTRDNEAEADRVGMSTLSRSGYDPKAMAEFFTTLQGWVRANQGGSRERTPDYLQTHPITVTRISEAKERAATMKATNNFAAPTTANPMLPGNIRLPEASLAAAGTGQFAWAKERMRVLSANTPAEAVREYEQMRLKAPLDDAQQYGLALARLQGNQPSAAISDLDEVLKKHPNDTWIQLAMGEAEARAGKKAESDARFQRLVDRMPRNRAVVLTYAQVLGERGDAASGKKAQAILRGLASTSSDDPVYQETFARASDLAGDPIRAGEAHAEAEYLNGRPERALVQLENLKKRSDLDYYARARIDARIAQITPTVLELHRQGVKDDKVDRN
ncbi:M48 family metalloprotease [Noviluteimonas gilva]|uniref:M48 family metalloprotease n=1 Tax=Noviluteimonas gilva TaxID=2682097 RepID=UPI001E4DD17F|nr:M48 family metalloprotease [Lysobacter gilvus]